MQESSIKAFFVGGVVLPLIIYLSTWSFPLFTFFLGGISFGALLYVASRNPKYRPQLIAFFGLAEEEKTQEDPSVSVPSPSTASTAASPPAVERTVSQKSNKKSTKKRRSRISSKADDGNSSGSSEGDQKKDKSPSDSDSTPSPSKKDKPLRGSRSKVRTKVRATNGRTRLSQSSNGSRPKSLKMPKSPSRLRELASSEPVEISEPQKTLGVRKSNSLLDINRPSRKGDLQPLAAPIGGSTKPPGVLKEGWISLQWNTGVKRLWNKRYFVLKDSGWLSYYGKEDWPNRCYAHICLHNAYVRVHKSKPKSKKFAFHITEHNKRPIYHRHIPGQPEEPLAGSQIWRYKSARVYLRTRSHDLRNEWAKAISDVCSKFEKLKGGKGKKKGHNRSFSASWVSVDTLQPARLPDTNLSDDECRQSLSAKTDYSSSDEYDEEDDVDSEVSEYSEDRDGDLEEEGSEDEEEDEEEEEEDYDENEDEQEGQALQAQATPTTKKVGSGSSSSSKGNFLTVLKNAVGMDMTKISMPVSYFEPTSFLQRLCEVTQYYHLLDKADLCDNSLQAMAYFAAYAISYHACNTRLLKPFNPYLGETFEFIDGDFRFFAEQVSHHPPIGAMIAENPHFRLDRDQGVKTRFGGNYLDVSPTGSTEVRLKRTGHVYSYNFVRAKVHNIILGTMYVDQFGEMTIRNQTTGDKAVIKLTQCGWLGRGQYETKGSITGGKGGKPIKIAGKWNEYIKLVDGGGLSWDEINEGDCLWRHTTLPIKGHKYSLTEFTLKMNNMDGTHYSKPLPKSDSRFRPDRAALETGDKDKAEEAKGTLENEQRALRAQRQERGEVWTPVYFNKSVKDGIEVWRYKGNYKDF